MLGSLHRGVRNAFRNPLRTISVTIILGISLGLVLVMLAARSAVGNRITEVKQSIGNTVTVSPAGARGFIGGGEPLTMNQYDTVRQTNHVTSVDATIDAQLRPGDDTDLESPIEAGTLGGRQQRLFIQGREVGGTEDFSPPIFSVGTTTATYGGGMIGTNLVLSSGEFFDASSIANEALVGKVLAEKNSLAVGSTFTAYSESITVRGIYDAGNQFANNTVVFSARTLQRLSDQADQLTQIVARVDSVENLSSTVGAIQTALGDAADVTSSEETAKDTVQPLQNISSIATTSLIGALIAAAVITLLTMVMIVRERRKEIAVLKAIGAGNPAIISQFVTESMVLSILGSVVGMVLGFVLSNPILRALLTSTSRGGPVQEVVGGPGGGPPAGGFRIAVGGFRALQGAFQDLQAVVDFRLVLLGIGAAILVAIVGSALPAWLVSKVRPAEVLRNE